MNKTIYQGNCLPNVNGIYDAIHKMAYRFLIKLLARLIIISKGMDLAENGNKQRKKRHARGHSNTGEQSFLEKNIKYTAISYIVLAMLVMPSGICSSSYQSPEFGFPVMATHQISDFINLYNNLIQIQTPRTMVEKGAETQPAEETADSKNPPFHSHILRASQTYEVDMALIRAIIMAESSNNPRAVSHRGAKGLMQLMPITAKSLGVDDAFDPALNIDGGVRYFKSLLDRYDGDVELALAAYNAGSRYVRKYGGVPPFKATQAYIKKVLKYRQMYQNEMASGQIKPTMG